MITTIIGLCMSVGVSVFIIRHETRSAHSDELQELPQIKYNNLCNNIDTLANLKTELTNVENMIIDIEMYSESDLTNITVSNSKYNCSVLVNSKSDLLKTLYMQRDYLRDNISSLLQEMIVKS